MVTCLRMALPSKAGGAFVDDVEGLGGGTAGGAAVLLGLEDLDDLGAALSVQVLASRTGLPLLRMSGSGRV